MMRRTMRVLLLLTLLEFCCSSLSHEQQLDDDELVTYFGTRVRETGKVPEYQIVHIEHLTSVKTSQHVTRKSIMDESAMFKIRAFDADVHLEVTKAEESYTDQTTTCVYLDAEGMETEEAIPRGCYYEGKVLGADNSHVSVSTCGGMTGTISRHGHDDLFIEPLREAHAVKRGMENKLGHVVYKAPKDETWECGVKDEEHVNMEFDSPDMNTKQGSVSQKYLKLHIVAEHQYWSVNGAKSCSCITATYNALAHRMALLPGMNLRLSKITIIKSSATLPTIREQAGTNLVLTRDWVKTQSEGPNWDHVALVVPYYMNVAGTAWSCDVCEQNRISVSYLGALYGVQVMAHEIGHNLCFPHDSGGVNCGRHTYVMGAAGWSTQEMGWSQCTLQVYHANVNSKACLNDA